MWRRLLLVISLFIPAISHSAGIVAFQNNGFRLQQSVDSFQERRQSKLIRQGWDISCGAAALSTVMWFYHGEKYHESTIALSMLKNTDPKRVRKRGGFSLLDLKRFVEAVGYKGKGYKGLTLEDLNSFKQPAIISVRIKDYDHFVVYRGQVGNRILVGDPAFGNLTLTIDEINEIWPNGIGFLVVKSGENLYGKSNMSPEEMDMVVPNKKFIKRFVHRIGPTPLTRRSLEVGQ